MRTRTIRQTVTLPATPAAVYTLFLSSRSHAAFTGGSARINRTPGGRFSVFDGYATGRHVTLEPGRTIVQTWRAADWPDGAESLLSLSFQPVPNGCRLTMIHSGVPADFADAIADGWKEYYWNPLKEYLKNR
ncbi:MAG: SRPBCC domain-containing protein [Bacteroidetes bacterium]|nr:SRPBCC domain-containing protein [Bacteroidota bacterium]